MWATIFLGQQIHNFNKTGSRNPYRSMGHKQISNLTKIELPNPSGRPKNAPNTRDVGRPHPTSTRPHPDPFINHLFKDLSLLTHIFRKSAKRRFSWCNSQLLHPSGRRAMRETLFALPPVTPGENRLRSLRHETWGYPSRAVWVWDVWVLFMS